MVWEARVRDIGEALDYEDGEFDMLVRISTAYHGWPRNVENIEQT